jgi:glutamate dehydrogenase/leucine dehydrogenase
MRRERVSSSALWSDTASFTRRHERLDKKMTTAFHAVHLTAQEYEVHNRVAAYLVAVSRVAEAVRLRGWA